MDEDILVRKDDTQNRDRILDEFNRSTLDEVGPVGGAEQGMKVLSEMNAVGAQEDEIYRNVGAKLKVI